MSAGSFSRRAAVLGAAGTGVAAVVAGRAPSAAGAEAPLDRTAAAARISLTGNAGASGLGAAHPTTMTSARHSWYALADGMVCVGSISDDQLARTAGAGDVLLEEHRFAAGKVPATRIDGRLTALQPGADPREARLGIHLADHAGFVLLSPEGQEVVPVRVRVERRLDRAPTAAGLAVARDHVRIEQPAVSAFAYALLPLADALDVISRATSPRVRIVHADDLAHLVATNDGTWFAHFFGPASRSGLTVDRPCSVGVRIDPGVGRRPRPRPLTGARVHEVVVAAPDAHRGAVSVTLPFSHPGGATVRSPGVTVVQETPLQVRVDLAAAPVGGQHRITFG